MIQINTKIKKIQDVKIGDVVLSFNDKDEHKEWQPVTELHRPIVKQQDQVFVEFDNGGTIVTSKKHPMLYFNADKKWVYKQTGDINIDDTCKAEFDKTYVKNSTHGFQEDEQFYDITVNGNNNFFAGDRFDSAVVIHNSATVFFPLWHAEVEDLLVLKNNKGTEETRVRHMDYGVQINGYLLRRLIDGQKITLFNPNDVPDLYDAFFQDQELFGELYEKYERARSVTKTTISAFDLFNTVIIERNNTGRLYIQFVDHSNTHSAFNENTSPIRMSNLCVTGDTMVTVQCGDNFPIEIQIVDLFSLMQQESDVKILSKDLDNDVEEFKRIEAFAKTNPVASVLRIEDIASNKVLECTPDHLVYTTNRGYVKADDLIETDVLDIR